MANQIAEAYKLCSIDKKRVQSLYLASTLILKGRACLRIPESKGE